MLDGVCSQDAKLAAIAVLLLRGMRAPVVLNRHRPMTTNIAAFEGIRGLESMAVRVLQTEVLVEHRVVIVETSQVKAGLGAHAMMREVWLAMVMTVTMTVAVLYRLSGLGL